MIRVCIFDLDGTMIDSVPDLADSLNHALRAEGLPLFTEAQTQANVGNGLAHLIRSAIPAAQDTPEMLEKLLAAYTTYYTAHCTNKTTVYAGMRELLAELKQRGIAVAVVTNKPAQYLDKILSELFAEVDFVRVVGAGEFEHKPAPDGCFAVLKENGFAPQECLYLGDTTVDVETAKNAGIDCVAVSWGYQPLSALTGAQYQITHPLQLLEIIDAK